MFWAAVSDGTRLNDWKTKPIRSRRSRVSRASRSSARSVPSSSTRPDVGRSSPAAQCRKVLLPEPDGPMIAVKEPAGSSSDTPRRASTAARPLP